MSESSRKIPTLDIKLSGPSTYLEWTISIENYLDLVPAGEYRVWDVITGDFAEPSGIQSKKASSRGEGWIEARTWKDANAIAL